MVHDVYVFGDSHWRVFFPFVNHAVTTGMHNAVMHEGQHDGVAVRTIDTTGNGLSGSTMWGLLNENSLNGARRTIFNTIDSQGGVDNVALVFGEVDARFHHSRYIIDGKLSYGRIMELVGRYVKFIDEDLLAPCRVRQNVFIYHGFGYPQGDITNPRPGQPTGDTRACAEIVNDAVSNCLSTAFYGNGRVRTIIPGHTSWIGDGVRYSPRGMVSEDGVHLDPKIVYERHTLPCMASRFYDRSPRELPF